MNVLIVEDNALVADLLADLLADEHVVRTTYSATQALEAVNEERFDIALLDIQLPDLRGDALACKLRSMFPELIMIAISGSSLDEIREGRNAGANFTHVLQKPIQFKELAAILSDLRWEA